jgi:hypothetical protein
MNNIKYYVQLIRFYCCQRLLLDCGGELATAQLSAVNKKTKIGNFAYLDISPS